MPGNYEEFTVDDIASPPTPEQLSADQMAHQEYMRRAFERRYDEYMQQMIRDLSRQVPYEQAAEEQRARLAFVYDVETQAQQLRSRPAYALPWSTQYWVDSLSSSGGEPRDSRVRNYWKSMHGTDPVNEDVATRFKAYASKEAQYRRVA